MPIEKSLLDYQIRNHAVRNVINFKQEVEYKFAYCKQTSSGLVFRRFSPYIDNFTSKGNKTVFVNTPSRVLRFSFCVGTAAS